MPLVKDGIEARDPVEVAFRIQSGVFDSAGAALCAHMCRAAHASYVERAVVFDLWRDWVGDPVYDYFPLRLIAAAHWLALRGQAPELAAHCPTCDGTPRLDRVNGVFDSALLEHTDRVRHLIRFGPQTNEVGRAAVLFGGFHRVSRRTRLPLRILELGASAGLNLLWDRYAYALGGVSFGSPECDVRLSPRWSGPPPPCDEALVVAERAGCDLNPLDLGDDFDRSRLESYVWADQPERLRRLRSAAQCALGEAPRVDRESALHWLSPKLEATRGRRATVVFHSAFWPYLDEPDQGSLEDVILRAGAAATREAPLAWLRYEGSPEMELRLDLWPGGDSVSLAHGENRGEWVRWHRQVAWSPSEPSPTDRRRG